MSLAPIGFFAAAGSGTLGSMDLISTTILTGSQASVTFNVSGLGSTYKHLQIRATARNTAGSGIGVLYAQFNGDTGSNYATHSLGGSNGSVFSSGSSSQTALYAGSTPFANQAANAYGASVIDIVDAFSATKNKTVRTLGGVPGGTDTEIRLMSGVWLSTAVLTSISLAAFSGYSLAVGSRFSLYGIKG